MTGFGHFPEECKVDTNLRVTDRKKKSLRQNMHTFKMNTKSTLSSGKRNREKKTMTESGHSPEECKANTISRTTDTKKQSLQQSLDPFHKNTKPTRIIEQETERRKVCDKV